MAGVPPSSTAGGTANANLSKFSVWPSSRSAETRPANSIDMAAWPVCSCVITSGDDHEVDCVLICWYVARRVSSAWTDSGLSSVGVADPSSNHVPPSEPRYWL